MQPRISHQPTDRNKARWKSVALLALVGFWLLSGVVGRDPWKPDEPVYIGILQSMFESGGAAWWVPTIAGIPLDSELILIHWFNAPIVWLATQLLPLHEAARVSSIAWAALGIASLAGAARRWSGSHISYLAAIIAIGCMGLYDRAHAYVPDIALFAAIALAIYGMAELTDRPRRATAMLLTAVVIGFAARSALGYLLLALPLLLLCFAPVYSMYRVPLIRALILSTFVCATWITLFALNSPESFEAWLANDLGFVLEDRQRFGPTFYLGTLAWFAWPAWPVAIWLVSLRVRGFDGGWQRGEVIAPVVWLISSYALISLLTEPRAVHAIYLLPPLVVLAAFGVDTLKRSWYALIDWFGILVLGLTALLVVLAGCAVYFGWPPMISEWLKGYVPGFKGSLPWLGYGIAMVAFVIWIALIQPAHQHSRRALINWAGCVTFLWVVAQALLLAPANHIMSYRNVFTDLSKAWPVSGCVGSVDMSSSQTAMLAYYARRVTEPVEFAEETDCGYVLLQRYRGEPISLPDPEYKLRFRGNRPGDSAEAFELYEKNVSAPEPAQPLVPPVQTAGSAGQAPQTSDFAGKTTEPAAKVKTP